MSYTHYPATSPTSRTGRKTLKYKRSEPVWSYELEEALLQGLAEYRPSSTRDPSLLRRFPRRNKWISNYIFQRTGKTRNAKQVGSRLQQLRETCSDTEILGLIVNKSFPSRSSQHSSVCGESSLPSSTASSPTSSSFPFIPLPPPPKSQSFVQVAVALVISELDPYCGSPNPVVTLDLEENGLSEFVYPEVSAFTHRAEIRSSGRLCQSPPEIKFSAQSLQDISRRYRSVTSVYRDNELVYTDVERDAYLQLAFFDENPHSALFSFKLVPEFWSHMSSNPEDYSQYRITQRITSVDMADASIPRDEQLLFSIEYSLEGGAPLALSEFEVQDLPPAMVGPPFLPNYLYSELPSAYDYNLLPDETLDSDLAYPQFPTFILPNQQQNFQFTNF